MTTPTSKELIVPAAGRPVEDTSGVNRLVGPLMKAIHEKNAKKVAVLTWDSEDVARAVARQLATAFTRQLDRKCAVVVSEGIRVQADDQPGYCLVTVPEYVMPTEGMSAEKKATGPGPIPSAPKDNPIPELNTEYPLVFIASGSLSELGDQGLPKIKIAMSADAHLLVLPKNGLTRAVSKGIEDLSRRHNLKWLGIVVADGGELHV